MKYIFFFILVGLFVWVALVPPDGMTKYPAVNVQFEYSKQTGEASLRVGKVRSSESAEESSQEREASDGEV